MTAKQIALKDISKECKTGFFKKNYLYKQDVFRTEVEQKTISI